MLQVTDLQAFYGKSHVLHGVNLQVGEGEIVALLGRNGSGRSTTFASSGALLQDGMVLVATLTQRLASEAAPDQSF